MQKYNATKFLKTIWHYFLIYTAISFGGMALPTIIGHEPFILLTFFIGLFYIVTKKTEGIQPISIFLNHISF